MRSRIMTLLTVIGAVTVLVLAGNTVALATTGHGFLLGKNNSANRVTTSTRTTAGSVLALHSKRSTDAPLVVNGAGKVAHLNADEVDGLSSATLVNKTYTYTFNPAPTPPTTSFSVTTPTVPAGSYLVAVSGWIYTPVTGSNAVICTLSWPHPASSGANQLEEYLPFNPGGYHTLNNTGEITLKTAQYLSYECDGTTSGAYSDYPADPVTISLTPIGQLVTH